jgi:energy-coupling factor transporter ATP-binding protein EcfA2
MSSWVKLAVGAYELGKDGSFLKRLRTKLRRKKRILVLGASGAGKTQFLHSLKERNSPRLNQRQRTTTVHKSYTVIDEYPFLMFDTPGQVLDEAKRKTAIAEAIKGRMHGIINVACYGYHEAAEAGGDQALIEKGPGIAKVSFLRERQEVERNLLSEWVPFLDGETTPWVLTVVSKADLWWPEHAEIQRYYAEGEYAQALGDLATIHSVVPYCSIIEPYYGSKTSGRFGETEKTNLRHNLMETILQLIGVTR